MGIIELFFTALALSADAFAVSICKGLATRKVCFKHFIVAGLWFGGFQALMPLIGYLCGSMFANKITALDHWIAFGLLVFLGASMIHESFGKEENKENCSFAVKTMFLMAVATSIDALAVGITFGLLPNINIIAAISFIGILTFIVSALGIKLGNIFGMRYKAPAERAGGTILIIIGVKILIEHLFF